MVTRRDVTLAGAAMTLSGRMTPARADAPVESPLFANAPKGKLKGLILGPGPAGRCDDAKLGIGVPLWDARGNRWIMWYYCRGQDAPAELPPTLGSHRIAVAVSADGIVWNRLTGLGRAGAIMEPSPNRADFDSLHVGLTDVTFADGRYFMWYFGGDHEELTTPVGRTAGLRMRPGLATSADGMVWTKVRGPGPGGAIADTRDGLYSAWHNALHADGKIYMYTSVAARDLSRWDTWIYTTSDHGRTWSVGEPLKWLDKSPGYDGAGELTRSIIPNPLKTGHRWLMAYTALNGAKDRFQRRSHALAVSDDALSWRRLYDAPIFEIEDESAWDGGGVAAPHLRKVGDQWRLYYYGFARPEFDKVLPKGVGLAIGAGADLRKFTRVPPV
ncbi:MAG: hypothetical protein SFV21_07595 [Rhodospirillaceae bacterium]|nr:hypothetical protein [Rhodospirillaceae bacterium]